MHKDEITRVERGVRIDLVIAIFALLISMLAASASWWQARVLEQQLGAQVWPYVGVSVDTTGDKVQIDIENDGLGPAILRSAVAMVDGVPKSNFMEILHAVLGRNLVARRHKGERLGLSIGTGSPGSVLRPGESSVAFGLVSSRYARPFAQAFNRMSFRICYCAIVPGKCWLSDSRSMQDPKPVSACPEVPNDLLHASTINELFTRNF
jgi:hypothetical protein